MLSMADLPIRRLAAHKYQNDVPEFKHFYDWWKNSKVGPAMLLQSEGLSDEQSEQIEDQLRVFRDLLEDRKETGLFVDDAGPAIDELMGEIQKLLYQLEFLN